MEIGLSGIINDSVVDGPGIRIVFFFQGCNHYCEGCHNPDSWNVPTNDQLVTIDRILLESVVHIGPNSLITGFTISGGEPFDQPEGLLLLCRKLKTLFPEKTIWVYTGYKYEELNITNDTDNIGSIIDIIVDGEFKNKLLDLDLQFRGSSNQRIIDVKRSVLCNNVIEWSNE